MADDEGVRAPRGARREVWDKVQPNIRIWDTTTALSADFAAAWDARLSRSAHAHFAMRLDYLEWEAAHGRHARAVLVEEGGRLGALVLRREGRGFVCGWPWRCQVALEDSANAGPSGLDAALCDWAVVQAQFAAHGDRVRVFVPRGEAAGPSVVRGTTIIKDLAFDDEKLAATFDSEKRRVVRKLEKAGWQVIEGTTSEHHRAFRQLQYENDVRLGRGTPSAMVESPERGEDWREWELPWQWLLLAVHEGVVHAGSGYGRAANGMVDYRANASTPEGRKAGANTLIAWAALTRSRDAGYRWMNWGGNTTFKKQLGGETVVMTNRLGGGALWAAPNAVELAVGRTRASLAKWVKEHRQRSGGGGNRA